MDNKSQSTGTIQSHSTYTSSSQSNNTNGSNDGQGHEHRQMDLTKDNAASPIDLECHIQEERITKILGEAIFKTKLAICLPNLVQEYKTLNAALSTQHMDDLLFIFEQYENPLFSASLMNLEAMEDIKAGDVSLKNRLNPELSHLLYIMNSYPAIRPKVEEMVQEMRNVYQEDANKVMHPSMEYLLALEHFRELMIKQMVTTAAEELSAKITTRKLEASNTKLLEKIQEYTICLKEEQENFEAEMALKAQTIAKLEHEVAMLNVEGNVKLKNKILDSERQMVLATRSHKVKNEMLQEEEVEFREAYDIVLRQDIIEEKNQRARRCKVETQLMSWLQKYDLEMADKQTELDELTEMHKEEVRKSEECEAKLAEQDKEYIPLMEEREAEYHQEMLEKMTKFLHEHAARVIQVAWREVLANRAEKKKLKKQVKKMQEAQAAAAAAAEAEARRIAAAEKRAKKAKQ